MSDQTDWLDEIMSSIAVLLLDARRQLEPHFIAASSGAASELDYYAAGS